MIPWSKVGDLAWSLGFGGVADLAYAQGFRQMELRHARAAVTPVPAQIVACRHPECSWLMVTTDRTEAMVEYSQHECPMPECGEEEEDW